MHLGGQFARAGKGERQRRRQGWVDRRHIMDRGQWGKGDAIRKLLRHLSRTSQRQPGFAHPARPHQRHQAQLGLGQQFGDLGHFPCPTYQGRRLGWQGAGAGSGYRCNR